jgi:hypothetical protein
MYLEQRPKKAIKINFPPILYMYYCMYIKNASVSNFILFPVKCVELKQIEKNITF